MKLASKPLPHGKHTVTPYLCIKGAAEFIDFLKKAFNATEFGRVQNPDGLIGHAEVQVGDSTLMIFDSKEDWAPTPAFLSMYIDDADEVYRQALKAGATQVTEMTTFNIIGDRAGRLRDPFGNVWWIQTHLRDVSPEESVKLLQDPKEMEVMQKMQQTFDRNMDQHLK